MVEMLQFKQRILKERLTHANCEDADQFLILSERVPKSLIVHGTEARDDLKRVARRLYVKYCRIGAALEINIDSATRQRYRQLMEDEQRWTHNAEYDDDAKLYLLFNDCLTHMMALIAPSFVRFRQSKEYRLLKKYTPPNSTKTTNSRHFEEHVDYASPYID